MKSLLVAMKWPERLKSYMEAQKTLKFLMGLNESYATVRSNTLMIEPLSCVNKAYLMALHHERQGEVSSGKTLEQPETTTFVVKETNLELDPEEGETKCGKCDKTNHITKNCCGHLKCIFCNWKGHTYEYCRKRKVAVEGAHHRS